MKTVEEAVAPPTRRQLEMLTLHSRGMTFGEIGRVVEYSEWTVKYHLDRLRQVLQARNLSQAVVVCLARGHLCIDGRDCRLFVPDEDVGVAA